jgi:GPH family glycoside/pentoside/hexuronide:cation symporter
MAAGSGFWILYGSMTADVIDYDEIETGNRREGAFAACASWIMKLGVAMGSWASGEILEQVGFKQALGGDQSHHTIFMIRILLASIPVIGLIVALIFLIRFPLTQKKMGEIRQILEARRGKV